MLKLQHTLKTSARVTRSNMGIAWEKVRQQSCWEAIKDPNSGVLRGITVGSFREKM